MRPHCLSLTPCLPIFLGVTKGKENFQFEKGFRLSSDKIRKIRSINYRFSQEVLEVNIGTALMRTKEKGEKYMYTILEKKNTTSKIK